MAQEPTIEEVRETLAREEAFLESLKGVRADYRWPYMVRVRDLREQLARMEAK